MGYIEIEDDSTWKKVDEKNWDKDRQILLCQYFGFEEAAATIEKRNIPDAQKFATGDLICYKTQPNRTSCCAHLQPSLSLKSTIPYVQCKYRSTNRRHKVTSVVEAQLDQGHTKEIVYLFNFATMAESSRHNSMFQLLWARKPNPPCRLSLREETKHPEKPRDIGQNAVTYTLLT